MERMSSEADIPAFLPGKMTTIEGHGIEFRGRLAKVYISRRLKLQVSKNGAESGESGEKKGNVPRSLLHKSLSHGQHALAHVRRLEPPSRRNQHCAVRAVRT